MYLMLALTIRYIEFIFKLVSIIVQVHNYISSLQNVVKPTKSTRITFNELST